MLWSQLPGLCKPRCHATWRGQQVCAPGMVKMSHQDCGRLTVQHRGSKKTPTPQPHFRPPPLCPFAAQGYGFNTFGEVVACWIQDIILIALVFKDRRTQPWVVVLAAAAFTAGCSFLLSPSCPQQLLATMQASNIAVMALGSRLPQILLNMRRGNAGMLSVTTCLLNVAGNAARIFTTIVLTGDLLMLGGACSQGAW